MTTASSLDGSPAFANDKPSTRTAPAAWPFFDEEEIEAVIRVLRSGKVNYWTGEEVRRFEREFAEFVQCKYAVALANGTVALEAALRALGVGAGDDVVTTSRTFIASASCVVAVGARPIIADVDRNSQNVTAATVQAALTPATKAIVAVHLAGWPCAMDEVLALARQHGLHVIEDCAQAQGARYKGRPVGCWGDVAAFSFCQDKIMTTGGEGGMLTTNNEEIWRRAWSYKDHGKRMEALRNPPLTGSFRWLHDSFGTNWRMTEMQAAIGRVALRKVPAWIERRRRFAARLNDHLADLPGLRIPRPPREIDHAYYKYYAFVRAEMLAAGWDRDRILKAINADGIACLVGSCSEIYREKAFSKVFSEKERLPVAKELGETSLMFMVHPTLSDEYIENTCLSVRRTMLEATESRGLAASVS